MSERRTPYTTANLPRQPRLASTVNEAGETAASFEPPATPVIHPHIKVLTDRIVALEAAAREVVKAIEALPPAQTVSFAREDIRPQLEELGRLVGEEL